MAESFTVSFCPRFLHFLFFVGVNAFRNLFFSAENCLCCSPLISTVKHKTKLLQRGGLPSPFNIEFKKDMSTGGWQLAVGNHIRWPLHHCVCVYVCKWGTVELQGSRVNEGPCCWQETKYCSITFHDKKTIAGWSAWYEIIYFIIVFSLPVLTANNRAVIIPSYH